MADLPDILDTDLSNSNAIAPAQIDWQTDDSGHVVPISARFGDVYFSRADGLAESQFVFLDHNQLAQRWAALPDYGYFVVGEIGFGTGLNVLAAWQLWRHVRPDNHSRLHIITTEKYPLQRADLARALATWTPLAPLAQRLLDHYPPLLAGCHRLNFFDERLTLDLWFGDAITSLQQCTGQACVDAWWLDGFAPARDTRLWSDALFAQIRRLSKAGTTLATFSAAQVVKSGLQRQGFVLNKVKGYGKKRHMLTGVLPKNPPPMLATARFRHNKKIAPFWLPLPFRQDFYHATLSRKSRHKYAPDTLPDLVPDNHRALTVAVVGAGVAGLAVAYSLAQRGHRVWLLDRAHPLAGASGNIRALLAPKLHNVTRFDDNLHLIGYLAGLRFYPALQALLPPHAAPVLERVGVLDLLAHQRRAIDSDAQASVADFAVPLDDKQVQTLLDGKTHAIPPTQTPDPQATQQAGWWLADASLINTQIFAEAVLRLPNITFCQTILQNLQQTGDCVTLQTVTHANAQPMDLPPTFDHAVLCMARDTAEFLPHVSRIKYSRGQISWFALPTDDDSLPPFALKYGGYLATFGDTRQRYALLGASFVRGTSDTRTHAADHEANLATLQQALPTLASQPLFDKNRLPDWQGRASLRAQTPDYLPVVGQVWAQPNDTHSRVWTFAALGSKGYAYAPICGEFLVGLMGGEMLPLPRHWLATLSPNRKALR